MLEKDFIDGLRKHIEFIKRANINSFDPDDPEDWDSMATSAEKDLINFVHDYFDDKRKKLHE